MAVAEPLRAVGTSIHGLTHAHAARALWMWRKWRIGGDLSRGAFGGVSGRRKGLLILWRQTLRMPNYVRPKVKGATVFFTVALVDRNSDLLIREVERLRQSVRATWHERPFKVDAWVVLPDHLHCVWTLPEGDRDFAIRWGAIKSRFTRSLRRVGFHPTDPASAVGWNPTLRSASKVSKGDAGLWQRRFWEHHIRGDEDYHAHVNYCWINPVKHGLVERPEDWLYSSFHRDRKMAE